jgi:hypothetical protein
MLNNFVIYNHLLVGSPLAKNKRINEDINVGSTTSMLIAMGTF